MPQLTLETTIVIACCFAAVMTIGFAARQRRWGPILMVIGILGFLGVISFGIVTRV
jgi:multisubunit Na+/H+ antiporter MnhF subunit